MTDMDKDTIARLRGLLEKADVLPLEYATGPNDDWGQIRCGAIRPSGLRADLCRVRFPYADDEAKSAHWKAGTDPYEASARLLVEAMNALPALLSIAERAADVEGMAQCLLLDSDLDPEVFIGMHGGLGHWGDTATAVSRYVLGGE